jgi:hypothetical protein
MQTQQPYFDHRGIYTIPYSERETVSFAQFDTFEATSESFAIETLESETTAREYLLSHHIARETPNGLTFD